MKFKSIIFSEASGSVAGITFSHNLGGMYVRARAIPTNPGSPQQAVVRAAFGGLVSVWTNLLTEPQRAAWRVYASNVPLVDALGELRTVTGMNHFLRSNTLRVAFGYPRVDEAPVVFNVGYYSTPTFSVDASADTVAVGFNVGDDWVDINDCHLVVYASRPQNESVNFFKGPYRFAGSVAGDSVTPPTSPETINLPFPCGPGQRVFFLVAVSRADGRRSLDFRNYTLAT